MSDLIYRHKAIKTITSHNGVVDKSVAKRLLLQMKSAQPEPMCINFNEPIKVKLTDWGKPIGIWARAYLSESTCGSKIY